MRRLRVLPLLLLAAVVAAAPACTSRNCVPDELAKARHMIDLDLPPDAHAPVERSDVMREIAEEFRRRAGNNHPPGTRPYQFLALSGGGMYGAFGAGVLAGWTETGTRPRFDVVSGISVGAFMSTFVFLGPQYDELIRREGVGVDFDEILRRRSVLRLPFADAFFSSEPLRRKIEEALTPQVLCEVAREHALGRRLYIGTTNIDARKLVIWDMGAIASRGTPEAFALYRQVVLASGSVPGAFPPVRIPVEIDGRQYEELHVDGGASDEVLFRPFMVADLNRVNGVPGTAAPPGSVVYLVNNGKLYAEPGCVRPRIIPQIGASYQSILYNKGRDEFFRIYLTCMETAVDFRLTAIPQEFRESTRGALQVTPEDQHKLYAIGRELGHHPGYGEGWRDVPPGTDPTEQALPRAGTRFASDPKAGHRPPPSAPPPGGPLPPPKPVPPR